MLVIVISLSSFSSFAIVSTLRFSVKTFIYRVLNSSSRSNSTLTSAQMRRGDRLLQTMRETDIYGEHINLAANMNLEGIYSAKLITNQMFTTERKVMSIEITDLQKYNGAEKIFKSPNIDNLSANKMEILLKRIYKDQPEGTYKINLHDEPNSYEIALKNDEIFDDVNGKFIYQLMRKLEKAGNEIESLYQL